MNHFNFTLDDAAALDSFFEDLRYTDVDTMVEFTIENEDLIYDLACFMAQNIDPDQASDRQVLISNLLRFIANSGLDVAKQFLNIAVQLTAK